MTEAWTDTQKQRYRHALNAAWDDFEEAYQACIKRVGIHSMAARHATDYMQRARNLKMMVDTLLAKPTYTSDTPQAIRDEIAKLVDFKNRINRL